MNQHARTFDFAQPGLWNLGLAAGVDLRLVTSDIWSITSSALFVFDGLTTNGARRWGVYDKTFLRVDAGAQGMRKKRKKLPGGRVVAGGAGRVVSRRLRQDFSEVAKNDLDFGRQADRLKIIKLCTNICTLLSEYRTGETQGETPYPRPLSPQGKRGDLGRRIFGNSM